MRRRRRTKKLVCSHSNTMTDLGLLLCSLVSDADLDNLATLDTTKSDTNNDLDLNEDRRRSSRATTTKNYAKQDALGSEDDDGEEDYGKSGRRPPPRRMRYKKRLGSDDSFVDDDDDYEKIARKREIVKYGKSTSRSSITDHLKKLVDDEDGSAENKGSGQFRWCWRDTRSSLPRLSALPSDEATNNDQQEESAKRPKQNSDEPQPSDDDDFPDEQEIFKANGLLSLKKNLNGPVGFSENICLLHNKSRSTAVALTSGYFQRWKRCSHLSFFFSH